MVDAPATERGRMIWLASSEVRSLRDSTPNFPYGAALKVREYGGSTGGRCCAYTQTPKLAQRNANTALNLVSKSFNAKSFAELIELNLMHSFNQLYALFRQVDEFGELFVRVIADIAEAAVSHVEEESNGSR